MLILTSFKKSKKYVGQKFSIARFQPSGFVYPELTFLAATGANGEKLLLEDFEEPILGYERAYLAGIKSRWPEIKQWLDSLDNNKTIILCCWCPYSLATKAQITNFGSFCCHSGIIGQLVNKSRPDISIIMDDDRKYKLLEKWKPNYIEDSIGE